MKQAKWILFTCSMIVMILLLIFEIRLNLEWYQLEQEYEGTVSFFLTAPSMELESRIFRIDMALAAIVFVNFVAIVAFFVRNYQALIDRWRTFRGVRSRTLSIPEEAQ